MGGHVSLKHGLHATPVEQKNIHPLKVLDCDFVVIMFGEFVLERQYYIFVRMGGWRMSIVFYPVFCELLTCHPCFL